MNYSPLTGYTRAPVCLSDRGRCGGGRLGADASLCVAERDGLTGMFAVRAGF